VIGKWGVLTTLVLAIVAGAACFTPKPADVAKMDYAPAIPKTPTASDYSLYIVLDPEDVPAQTKATGVHGWKFDIEIHNLRHFVRIDLADAMREYFAYVDVVGPSFRRPSKPHLVAYVEVDRLGYALGPGELTYGTISWSFALGFDGDHTYLFSYAAKTTGNQALNTQRTTETYASVFEAALNEMLEAYAERGVHAKLLESQSENEK
jgi:hypothetical protein